MVYVVERMIILYVIVMDICKVVGFIEYFFNVMWIDIVFGNGFL